MWGFTNLNFKLNLKVSAFYLEKQKSFIPKKNFFLAVPPRYIQKMALAVSIFQKVLVKSLQKSIANSENAYQHNFSEIPTFPNAKPALKNSVIRNFNVYNWSHMTGRKVWINFRHQQRFTPLCIVRNPLI